jgi:hypothetical protein
LAAKVRAALNGPHVIKHGEPHSTAALNDLMQRPVALSADPSAVAVRHRMRSATARAIPALAMPPIIAMPMPPVRSSDGSGGGSYGSAAFAGNCSPITSKGGAMMRGRSASAAMPRSKPARCRRSDRPGVRCRSIAGSCGRERRFFGGCQPERRSGSCLRAGWQATRCRLGSPPA